VGPPDIMLMVIIGKAGWSDVVQQDLRFSQRSLRRMPSFGILCRVGLVRTDVSEEQSTFIIRVTRISELGTLAVTSNRRTV
jgi:hypothetical protein